MILDIDFDFFVKETVFHDFAYQESKLFMQAIWGIRFMSAYSNPCGEPVDLTREFILDNEAMNEILDFVKKCSCVKNWAVSDIHLFAYKYIENYSVHSSLNRVNRADGIVHIDRHSDYDTLRDEINAGNWLRYIKENVNREIPIYWIPQSKNDLYVDKESVRKAMKIKNRIFLKSLNPLNIEHIYLCRSSAWVPPWLDSAYFKFQGELEKLFGIPIHFDPIPKDREWNYEKIMRHSLEERRMIMESWSQRTENVNNAKE